MIPNALLLHAPGCPHCPNVRRALEGLVAEGLIGELERVDLSREPERAEALGVRSVPWARIGEIELEGAQSPAELRRAAELAATPEGVTRWLGERLADGGLAQVEAKIRRNPALLPPLTALLAETDTPMQVRLGLGALFESLHGTGLAAPAAEPLIQLAAHPDPRVRADACHCLGHADNPAALPALRQRLTDDDPEVREIAEEAVERLTDTP